MIKSSFEFEVQVGGRSVKEYTHKGSTYIEGKEGSSFSLRMKNNSGSRVLFVPTVDGLSIMNGKHGSFDSRGYIVRAYDSLTIDGWRTSNDNVAEFFFSSPKQSYAKKINKGGNLGVIGCAVFKEKYKEPIVIKEVHHYHTIEKQVPQPMWPQWGQTYTTTGTASPMTMYSCSNASAGGAGATAMNCVSASGGGVLRSELGTGFGDDKYSPVTTVDFDRESSPKEVFSIYYNTKSALQDMGIEFVKPVYVGPSAFPNEDGYCPRP